MLENTMTVLIAVSAVTIVLLHVLTVCLRGIAAKVAGGFGIFMHLALIAFMLVRGVELEWLVLSFMLSLLVYASAYALRMRFCRSGGEVKEERDDV